jgi:hypothetical protein
MLCHKLCQYQRANGLAIARVVAQKFASVAQASLVLEAIVL